MRGSLNKEIMLIPTSWNIYVAYELTPKIEKCFDCICWVKSQLIVCRSYRYCWVWLEQGYRVWGFLMRKFMIISTSWNF